MDMFGVEYCFDLEIWVRSSGPFKVIKNGTVRKLGQRSRSQGHVISLSRVGPMAHKSKTNSRSVTKISSRVPHDTCYIAHQFQGQKVKGQSHKPTNADTQNMSYVSYSHSIVTMALSCIISDISRDSGRKSRFFDTPCIRRPLYGGPSKNIAITFGLIN